MSKKLLIDARQEDETRLVLLNDDTIENFDYETSHRRPIKGNIYLARVTRVEPSLQAAFVEYGGNRQGFLPFSEIHPDYYRIPVEDREKLLAEEKALSEAAAQEGDGMDDETHDAAGPDDDSGDDNDNGDENDNGDADAHPDDDDDDDEDDAADGENGAAAAAAAEIRSRRRKRAHFSRRYKIQEVISNRQILLVQAVKEERGSKGAAFTTYLSLAGRYCVLMPNTHHGGGVSRKISSAADRKKLKTIVGGLDIPDGMAVIVRTAGARRTKTEIRRDCNYLMNSWNDIRARTMESNAPALIHEEGNLVKRAVRDYYGNDVDEIIVDGKEAYKAAKGHMKNLMPSHARKVKEHKPGSAPLLQKYRVEEMLASMHEAQVRLKSGGYLVINQTEALVAIDVNSGRATRERNIEETALKTNLEAAEALAHQLRLRDLSGLIVIDFIDMDIKRNRNAVERKLKEAVKPDRARIQLGGISKFGLLEMSRQRLRPSLTETVTGICPHCEGSGRIHAVESAALFALHAIEARAAIAAGGGEKTLLVRLHGAARAYLAEHKSDALADTEKRNAITITLEADDALVMPRVRFNDEPNEADDGARRGRGGRRGGRSSGRRGGEAGPRPDESAADSATEDDPSRRKRRRGKRGGRRRRRGGGAETDGNNNMASTAQENAAGESTTAGSAPNSVMETKPEAGGESDKKTRAKTKRKTGAKTKSRSKSGGKSDTKTGTAAKAKTKAAAKKSAKAKAKAKATSANSAEPAAKTEKKSAEKSKAKSAEKSPAKSGAKPGAKSSTSAAVNIVNVDSVAGGKRKSGWWSN